MISITDLLCFPMHLVAMERSLITSVAKLAMFGKMAGFSLDEMIKLLAN